MSKRLVLIGVLVLYSMSMCLGQYTISVSNASTFEKGADELIIPIKLKVSRESGRGEIAIPTGLVLDTSSPNTNLPAEDLQFLAIQPKKSFAYFRKRDNEAFSTFYLIVKKDLEIQSPAKINLTATLIPLSGSPLSQSTTVTLKRANDLVYTLTDYLENKELLLEEVVKVESSNNTLTIYGYTAENNFAKRRVALERNNFYVLKNSWDWTFTASLMTVPFKIRPKLQSFPATATSGLTNVGVNFDFYGKKKENYFATGTKSTKKFGVGVWFAPSVEELDSVSTRGYLRKDVKSKQFFLSAGIPFSFSYNNVTISVVPLGIDIATSRVGNKWVYKNRPWFGFGIGVDPKIFAAVINK